MLILWMDEILHHFETTGNHGCLAFTRKLSFQGFLGGAGFRPPTVWVRKRRVLRARPLNVFEAAPIDFKGR